LVPASANPGACLVAVANLALPLPPLPPFEITKD